jgi:nicotinate-nucleotide adenylyltransferase
VLNQVSAGKLPSGRPPDISATRIREALARGEPVEAWLPPAVLEYIHANRVYVNRGN